MLEYTDRHMRFFMRLLTQRSVMWTEMAVSNALVHAEHDALATELGFDGTEHPIVLQIGGSDVEAVRESCRIARPFGYDGFNLNCGCPSDKV
ncbi:unnamed protein product, partial [Phaeothamnion confervicola]